MTRRTSRSPSIPAAAPPPTTTALPPVLLALLLPPPPLSISPSRSISLG
ncbi:hypothetical protein CsSME_00016362 [Camellia sinensis var. sinensis]